MIGRFGLFVLQNFDIEEDSLVSIWLKAFLLVCLAHLSEHVAQAIQVYALDWPVHKAGGVLGLWQPWLAHSETLHYGYALVMVSGLWWFRDEFTGLARFWWLVAFCIQFWHHFEHVLLFGQVLVGENFLNLPQPISVIQFAGLLNGSAESGFGGLLTMSHFGVCDCEGAPPGTVHEFTWRLIFVRRVEVHLLYNTLVTIPMVLAMVLFRPARPELK